MKKSIFALCVLALGLFACAKQQQVDNVTPAPANAPKYPVRLSLSGFLKETEVFSRSARNSGIAQRDSNLAEKVSHIYYIVYNVLNSSTPLRILHQSAAEAGTGFGQISDTLPAGEYHFFVFASPDTLNFQVMDDFLLSNMAARHFILPANGDTISAPRDVFFKKLSTTHPYMNESTSFDNFTLNRIISNLEVNILDAASITNQNGEISVKIKNPSNTFFMNDGVGTFLEGNGQFTPFNRHNEGTFSSYLLPTHYARTYTIEILARNKTTGDTIVLRNISDLKCEVNRKIVLSGNLLSPTTPPADPGASFGISLNEIWQPEQVIEF